MVLVKDIKKKLCLVLLVMSCSGGILHGQKVEKMIEKEAKSLWEYSVLIPLSVDTKINLVHGDFREGDRVYRIDDKVNDAVKGYVLSTSAMGRFDAFDYFLVFNGSMEVKLIKVAVYRSAHGSAICNKRWLKQFEGYQGGELRYGKDVQAVSGATISGESIATDIQRAQQLMVSLKKNKII